MKPASLTGVLIEKTLVYTYIVYLFENTTLWSTTKDQCLKYLVKACVNIGEIVSKKHADEKSKKKSFGFIYFLAKNRDWNLFPNS